MIATLVGPPGCGKSLIAAAAARAWQACGNAPQPEERDEPFLKTSGVDLRRRLEAAMSEEATRPGATAELVDRLAGLSLLVIEDIEGAAPSAPTVEVIVGAIDAVSSRGATMLVTASKPLGEVEGLTPRLVGRLSAGHLLRIDGPEEATRAALLAASGVRGEDAVFRAIARRLPADGRRVAAVAERLAARPGRRGPVTVEQAEAVLAETTPDASPELAKIVGVVAKYYRQRVPTLRGSSRKAPVVLARSVAIYLARELTTLSYDHIGRHLGGRDHSTVMHNDRKVRSGLKRDRALRSAMCDLLSELGAEQLANQFTGPPLPPAKTGQDPFSDRG